VKFKPVQPEWLELLSEQRLIDVCSAFEFAAYFNKKNSGWSTDVIAAFANTSGRRKSDGELTDISNLNGSSGYLIGHVGYNFKNQTEQVACRFPDEDGFSALTFFRPEIVVRTTKVGTLEIGTVSEDILQLFLYKLLHAVPERNDSVQIKLNPAITRDEYISAVQRLLHHIQRGDIYEVNFCQQFNAKAEWLNVAQTYRQLIELTDAPFGVLYKCKDSWLICGSPERYLRRKADVLISQPIKGTRKRSLDATEDAHLKSELLTDQKERSENVMIVDLVRNDLSKFALRGSVQVVELFGIHSFKTVHQMISTVQCALREDEKPENIIRCTFPMGSMTGAPKKRAVELAERYESQSRGIYSGTIGIIEPNGDFDFNVVIRSITWNAKTGYLSVMAGSAITSQSDPETEYEECLLKLEAMKKVIENAL
jgi:para-aminobenzoate synthetase component I